MTKRFYLDAALAKEGQCDLSPKLDHYVRHVLRLKNGDDLCIFNERDGAWRAFLHLEKRTSFVYCTDYIAPPKMLPSLGLAFCPLKHERLFFLIEKATELGVTDFFPLQTDYTQGQLKLNPDKIQDQMISTVQQCERFDIPNLHPIQTLDAFLKGMMDKGQWNVVVAMERMETKMTTFFPHELFPCVVVGPEGGWSDREKIMILSAQNKHEHHMHTLHLGELILRSETAALAGLVRVKHPL